MPITTYIGFAEKYIAHMLIAYYITTNYKKCKVFIKIAAKALHL